MFSLANHILSRTPWNKGGFRGKGQGCPRILFTLGNVQTGGAFLTVMDIVSAIRPVCEPLVALCDGRTLSLHDFSGKDPVAGHFAGTILETRTFREGVPWTTHLSPAYDETILGWCDRYAIDLVHAQHFLLAGLGWVRQLPARGIPLLVSFHDFYTACPSMNFVDRSFRVCPGGVTDGVTEATVFRRWCRHLPVLDAAFSHAWKRLFDDLVFPHAAEFTAPCVDVRTRLLENHPSLRARVSDFSIVPHGRDFASFVPPGTDGTHSEPIRVLLPGGNWPAKGSDILDAMAEEDGGRTVVFHIAGNAPRFSKKAPPPGIVLHGAYPRDGLAALVRSIRPDLGAVLSPLPETWCHVLTECWACGLPVLAFDVGAQGERMRNECPGGGVPIPLGTSPSAILRAIRDVCGDGDALRERRKAVEAWQRGPGAANGTKRMGAAYAALYRKLLNRQEPSP